jgi:3-oxoadipate enol-lactonase
VQVAGRGEFFLRDSGALGDQDDRPVVMLVHGWLASADLNWACVYGSLTDAGYRVLAIDQRGHGRGLRQLGPFRLADCAADTAAVLRQLELAPAVVVGYSMGGAIAQLVARDHPDVVSGLILSGTAQHWQEQELKAAWRGLEVGGVFLHLAPDTFWSFGFRRVGLKPSPLTAWMRSEMLRHNATSVIEAGRELRRFDSRPWLAPLPVPSAVVVTTRDTVVPPHLQQELAAALEATVFEAPIDHLQVAHSPTVYDPVLLEALSAVKAPSGVVR